MTLLLLLLKSLLVFALSGIALLCLRRASASVRHLVCLLTLAALLALPLFSVALPGWQVAGLQEEPTPQQHWLPGGQAATLPLREGEEFRTKTGRVPPAVPPDSAAPSSATPVVSSGTPRLPVSGGQALVPGRFLAFYLLGLLLASVRPLLGLWGIDHLRRACVSVTDAPTLSVSADCAAALRLSRLPLLCRADVPVPLTWGGRRPVVLLPSGSDTWPEDRLRSVLLHELAHVKRRDWSCHRLADFACAVYWFHPLVWLTARRLRTESEVACDDLVLSSGIAAPDYARHLLDIAGALSRPFPSQSAIAMAQTPHIKRRIPMILDKTLTRRTVTRRALLVALVPGTAALLTLAALRPSVKAQAETASADGASAAMANGGSRLNFDFGRMETSKHADGHTDITTGPDLTINGTRLFAGITDANKPGSPWWSASGALLTTPVYNTNAYHAENHAAADKKCVTFAFRLPTDAQGVTFQYELPQSVESSGDGAWVGKVRDEIGLTEMQQLPLTDGTRTVTAEFPASLAKATIRAGIASGPWKFVSKIVPGQEDTSAITTKFGSFIIGPLETTKSGDSLSIAVSQLTQDVRIVGVDINGNNEFPSALGGQSVGTLDQITAHFNFPIVPIKEVRVETRPFQWIEFKDVALQPVK